MNTTARIKRLEQLARVSGIVPGALPDPPRPWEEMTDEELTEWINNFI
jgi:hypothetical protein